MGSLPFTNDTLMVISDDDAFDQMDAVCEKDNIVDLNDEMDDDCEDDYIGRHDDCSEEDRGEDNEIRDYNHVDGSTEHATTVVLEDVQCNDHAIIVILEDVECDDLIYDNPISGDNGIRSLDDSDHERVNAGVSSQWIIQGACMIFFQTVEIEDMLALKEHFEIRVKRSCHTHIEVACKDKACKFTVCATKLLEGDYCKFACSTRLQGNNVTPLRPKEIMEEMNRKWGLQYLYGKAWRGNEHVESLVFSHSEELFQLLPLYFHMLECRKFWAIIWLMVVIDATHLKGRFKGILFVAVCKDENEQIYPIAFGIGHVEDEESWSWFLTQLRCAIGCPENAKFQRSPISPFGPLRKLESTKGSTKYRPMRRSWPKIWVVTLSTEMCSSGEFQIDLLPFKHAMAVIRTRSWVEGYAVPIFLIGHPSEWEIPLDVQ
ncbi:Uncharacterized protein TCM_035390 [Theobroma cacao]|uniref:MULE transposase domain-containing protein n=1 Tax=Theobroma cacao TaxID=3641 RepID=A0A061FHP5_THECC|nr:Uncharacterized protein TCM_035390 [Theobroma cacao]